MNTKTCSLTEKEITRLIEIYGDELGNKYDEEKIERINYFNRRLKAFKEEATKIEDRPKAQMTDTQADAINAAAAANPVKDGW